MGVNYDRNGRDQSQSRNPNATGYGNAVANRTARNTPVQQKAIAEEQLLTTEPTEENKVIAADTNSGEASASSGNPADSGAPAATTTAVAPNPIPVTEGEETVMEVADNEGKVVSADAGSSEDSLDEPKKEVLKQDPVLESVNLQDKVEEGGATPEKAATAENAAKAPLPANEKAAEDKKATIQIQNGVLPEDKVDEYFKQYELYAQKRLDEWFKGAEAKKVPKADRITGKLFAENARRIYLEKKNLRYVVPVQYALAQARLEGGVTRKERGGQGNIFNVGARDSGVTESEKKINSVEKGFTVYYNAMSSLYLDDKTPEELLKNGNFTRGKGHVDGVYASNPYYEIEIKAEIGIMHIEKAANRNKASVGSGGKNRLADVKFIGEMLATLGYLKVNEVENVEKVCKAVKEFQLKECAPTEEHWFQDRLAEVKAEKDQQSMRDKKKIIADGIAGTGGVTTGLLYYKTYLNGKIPNFIDSISGESYAPEASSTKGSTSASSTSGKADNKPSVIKYQVGKVSSSSEPGNYLPDLRLVQKKLFELGYLSEAAISAESFSHIGSAAGLPEVKSISSDLFASKQQEEEKVQEVKMVAAEDIYIPSDMIPETIEAINAFQREVVFVNEKWDGNISPGGMTITNLISATPDLVAKRKIAYKNQVAKNAQEAERKRIEAEQKKIRAAYEKTIQETPADRKNAILLIRGELTCEKNKAAVFTDYATLNPELAKEVIQVLKGSSTAGSSYIYSIVTNLTKEQMTKIPVRVLEKLIGNSAGGYLTSWYAGDDKLREAYNRIYFHINKNYEQTQAYEEEQERIEELRCLESNEKTIKNISEKYSDDLEGLGKELAKYAPYNSKFVKDVIKSKNGFFDTDSDDIAYYVLRSLSDAELGSCDKDLLESLVQQMQDAWEDDNHKKQIKRVNQILNPSNKEGEKKEKASSIEEKTGGVVTTASTASCIGKSFVVTDGKAILRDENLEPIGSQIIPKGTSVEITDVKVVNNIGYVYAKGFGWTSAGNFGKSMWNETFGVSKPQYDSVKPEHKTVGDPDARLRGEGPKYEEIKGKKAPIGDYVKILEYSQDTEPKGKYVKVCSINKNEDGTFSKGEVLGWTSASNLADGWADFKGPNASWRKIRKGVGKYQGQKDLVLVMGLPGKSGTIKKIAADSFEKYMIMVEAAANNHYVVTETVKNEEEGKEQIIEKIVSDPVFIGLNSGLRNYAEQEYLYDNMHKPGFNPAAVPGTSDHQNGIAFDLNNRHDEKVYNWLKENAWKYGFVRTDSRDKEIHHWEYRPDKVREGKYGTWQK